MSEAHRERAAEMKRTDTHAEWLMEPEGRALTSAGRLNFNDLARLNLDRIDRSVVMSPIESAADLFQTLEIVFRRLAQQDESGAPGPKGERALSNPPNPGLTIAP